MLCQTGWPYAARGDAGQIAVPVDRIRDLWAVLPSVGGKPVYGDLE